MDRQAIELNLRGARARVVAGQQALLRQRQHIRDLEQNGLDAAAAKSLLGVYEQSQAMNLFDRDRLRQALAGEALAHVAPPPRHRERDVIDLHAFDRKAA